MEQSRPFIPAATKSFWFEGAGSTGYNSQRAFFSRLLCQHVGLPTKDFSIFVAKKFFETTLLAAVVFIVQHTLAKCAKTLQ
jgi:hypothetical protein